MVVTQLLNSINVWVFLLYAVLQDYKMMAKAPRVC